MQACRDGQIDIARMLVGEFNANIDIKNTVRAISISCLCDDVRACRVGVVVNAVDVADIVTLLILIYVTTLSIAPLHLLLWMRFVTLMC